MLARLIRIIINLKPERLQRLLQLLLKMIGEAVAENEPKTFRFDTYQQATEFTGKVGEAAAEEDQRPQISIDYAGLPGESTEVTLSIRSLPAEVDLDRLADKVCHRCGDDDLEADDADNN